MFHRYLFLLFDGIDYDRCKEFKRSESWNAKWVECDFVGLLNYSVIFKNFRFWGLKYLIVIGGIIGAFFIPERTFGPTWMYFGMIGGLLFILIQLILIVDFAHSWAEAWVGNFEETESKGWYFALLGVTFLNYALSITGIVLLFVFFTKVKN